MATSLYDNFFENEEKKKEAMQAALIPALLAASNSMTQYSDRPISTGSQIIGALNAGLGGYGQGMSEAYKLAKEQQDREMKKQMFDMEMKKGEQEYTQRGTEFTWKGDDRSRAAQERANQEIANSIMAQKYADMSGTPIEQAKQMFASPSLANTITQNYKTSESAILDAGGGWRGISDTSENLIGAKSNKISDLHPPVVRGTGGDGTKHQLDLFKAREELKNNKTNQVNTIFSSRVKNELGIDTSGLSPEESYRAIASFRKNSKSPEQIAKIDALLKDREDAMRNIQTTAAIIRTPNDLDNADRIYEGINRLQRRVEGTGQSADQFLRTALPNAQGDRNKTKKVEDFAKAVYGLTDEDLAVWIGMYKQGL